MNAPAVLVAPPLARRMACWLYEGILLFAVALVAALVFSVATQMKHALQYREALAVFIALAMGAYCTWCWHKGQTLPMRTWRIAVVDRHGRRLTLMRAALRYACCSIWLLPPLAVAQGAHLARWEIAVLCGGWIAFWALLSRFHSQRQFWHDAMAGTRLVPA